MTLEQLKEIIDKNFCHPFVEKGHVRTRFIKEVDEKTLEIVIGPRDVWITENGRVTGAGTMLCQRETE